jgi:ssDNA-binding Zn-finger/Zn-ribbon topoisomerase 1
MSNLECAYDVICPACNKRMKLKLNKHTGQKFFGCSGYPDCHQTFSVVDVENSFEPYQEYLKSSAWEDKRIDALNYAEYKCQICYRNDIPLHVHHRTYERFKQERISDLVVLCRDCHAKFHDKLPMP